MCASSACASHSQWDECVAEHLLGSIVIVGLAYVDPEGQCMGLFQIYGVVTVADKERGIAVECHGQIWDGQEHWLPPVTAAFHKAKPGRYRLCSTGEVIFDPDYLTSWTFAHGTRH